MSLHLDFTEARDEDEAVRRWQMEQLIILGVDPITAALAAQAGIRWHDVETLTLAGCSAYTALEIVA